jgi:hypothetical protein
MGMITDILRSLLGLVCLWSVLGYFVSVFVKIPKDKKKTWQLVILLGPFCWGILCVIRIMEKLNIAYWREPK